MTGHLLAIGFVLAGQVSSGLDQYPASNGSGLQAPMSAGLDRNSGDNSRLQVIGDGEADSSSRSGSTLSTGAVDPYGPADIKTTTAPTSGSSRSLGGANSASPNTASPPPYTGVPASRNPSAGTTAPIASGAEIKPSALMRSMMTPPRGSQLSGRPTALAEVVANATSRAEQTQRVEAYWDLCSSVADYYLGLREQEELRQLIATVPRIGPTLQVAEKELAVRIHTAQRAALASQYRLANLVGAGPTALPLPADLPHCGSYHTMYAEIFASRPSAEAHELSELLPLRYSELKAAAAAVTQAEDWVRKVASAGSANTDGTGTAMALELLALHRRAFVQIARDYNRRIARYSELATPGEIGADRLIGMLIKRETTAAQRSAAGPPPNRQSNNSPANRPSTFAQGWEPSGNSQAGMTIRDSAVEPAAAAAIQGDPRLERSLLVKPR
jgi:hypothetical protein